MSNLIEGDMPDLKTDKVWVVLRVADVNLVARIEDVLPKNRLSPPLTYEVAHAFQTFVLGVVMRPMKKWWEKKAHENLEAKKHYKAWCVIRRVTYMHHNINKWEPDFEYEYVAVGRSNAPEYYDEETGKLTKHIHVDNLTKAEAYAMAKMLNFVGEVEE